MAITGVHVLVYTSEPDAVRAVFRDVLGFPSVDAGGGWLIFGLPPAELAVHPAQPGTSPMPHELALMCDDIVATKAALEAAGLSFTGEPADQGWGVTATLTLPGGAEVLVYEPRHATATGG